ncbi:hydrogenase maturation nickel metallochaperone HypA [Streptomyces sp. NBC_00536]|uniref:hydrogenase maturation nickel metallochaperone HypA/HybF n=1 Tax=Streptomyces sp. NBC_00536 TaxID=2975769 RepID=UPI002E803665|nr:hydrogenase maturation nickel metallochaperone HypA [Streptomyces sp. NBC_00536]WUC77343.1 hydrogenase maturation nickel metallochaperone HypA [Streptomyces sp. NBC_00536]
MHEMSIAMAVVGQVEEAARAGGARAVTLVRLQVGELAGVVPDALAFCFELACAQTVLEGAALVTEAVTARARCGACTGEWAVGMPPELCCPACGRATDVELLTGRELRILSVEWEDCPGPGAAAPAAARERDREPISEEH